MQGIREMSAEYPLVKAALDLTAGVAIIGTYFGWLPYVAAVIALVYHAIQIWETDTIREWTGRRKVPPPSFE